MKRLVTCSLTSLGVFLACMGCGESDGLQVVRTDGNDDTATNPAATDTDSETHTATDTQEQSDSDSAVPGLAGPGEPCYTDFWPPSHPNFGQPDCRVDLTCIGNDSMTFCSQTCILEGEINEVPGGLLGYCCGSPFDPCSGKSYWLPAQWSSFCIPRSRELGQSCDRGTEWTGEERRCAPICGEGQSHSAICAEPLAGTRLCTVACDALTGDADCALRSEFSGGCCGPAMGGTYCLTADLCVDR